MDHLLRDFFLLIRSMALVHMYSNKKQTYVQFVDSYIWFFPLPQKKKQKSTGQQLLQQ